MIFMYIMGLILPIISIVNGVRWAKNPPPKINEHKGYRTTRSMRSQATWDFAHRHFSKVSYYAGGIMLLLILSAFIIFRTDHGYWPVIIVLVIQAIMYVLSIIPTEQALKRNFDNKGYPRRHMKK